MEQLYRLKDALMDSLEELDTLKGGQLKMNELEAINYITDTIKVSAVPTVIPAAVAIGSVNTCVPTATLAVTVNGKNAVKIWNIMSELMESVKLIQPKLYNAVMRKISEN